MRCNRCGNNMPNDAKFCDRCGEPLRKRKTRYEYDYDDDYDDDEYETYRYENQHRNNRSNKGRLGSGILIFLTIVAVCVTILLALNMYLPSKNSEENSSTVANNQQQSQNYSDEGSTMTSGDSGQDEYNNPTGRDLSNYYYAIDYYNSNYNDSNAYLFPGSDTRYIDPEELSGCSSSQLAYIRNEIFARHGYIFKTDKYNNYFGNKNWYYPNSYTTDNVSNLNAYEKYNVELIKSME